MESALQSSDEPRLQMAMGLLKTLALIGVTWLVYWPSLQNGFIWDDKLHLLDNIVLKPNGLFRVWFTTDYINYWPLTWTSYWLEHQYWGLNPTGYHVTNLVLHTIGSLLIWRVLCALKIPAAWFAAVVFAIHPVNVESVAWIAQRKNVLCLVFYVMSVLAYLRLILAYMALPTIVSITEDALYAVPKEYRDGSLAIGATKWQTVYRVVLPAARSGIVMAVMLGIGRAIGETMAVMLVTGNAANIPEINAGIMFNPVRTMTATIAAEMGEVAQGSTHYSVLFAIGIVLFVITFLINSLATKLVGGRQNRRRSQL